MKVSQENPLRLGSLQPGDLLINENGFTALILKKLGTVVVAYATWSNRETPQICELLSSTTVPSSSQIIRR